MTGRPVGDDRPLSGIRVLDFTRVVSGPYCTMMLGDFGADVIKIEEPAGGDELRALGPPFLSGESVFFLSVNRNKRSVALDLKDAAALEALRNIVRSVDVVVENFRPGVMERLGLGYETLCTLNPRLIYCSISAYHHQSRFGDRPGYDLLISGVCGLQSLTGEPDRAPVRPGVNVVDLTAGTNAVVGILLAIIRRQATGVGQKVDVSLMDGALGALGQLAALYLNAGIAPSRRPPEDLHPQVAPYGTFMTADERYLNVCVPNNKFWASFCEALDRRAWIDHPGFATNAQRLVNRGELISLLVARFREDSRDRWILKLLTANIPAGPVYTLEEALDEGYFDEVGMLERMAHPLCGTLTTAGIPIRLSESPGAVHRPPPLLGEHTDEVLGELGSAGRC